MAGRTAEQPAALEPALMDSEEQRADFLNRKYRIEDHVGRSRAEERAWVKAALADAERHVSSLWQQLKRATRGRPPKSDFVARSKNPAPKMAGAIELRGRIARPGDCRFCGETLGSAQLLRAHEAAHSHACTVCKAVFRRYGALVAHMKRHEAVEEKAEQKRKASAALAAGKRKLEGGGRTRVRVLPTQREKGGVEGLSLAVCT